MKTIWLDIDGILVDSGGFGQETIRPYIEIIIDYCCDTKVRLYLTSSTRPVDDVRNIMEHLFMEQSVAGYFHIDTPPTDFPDLVISCNGEWLKKYPGIMVPFYNPDIHNKYANVALVGSLLESIKDRVVLNKTKTDPPKIKPIEKNAKPEDTSQYGFSI